MKSLRSNQKRTSSPVIITLLIMAGTIAFVCFLIVLGQSLRTPPGAPLDVKSGDTRVESEVSSLAAEFICACGDCDGESLVECTCEAAQKARQAIRELVQAGRSRSDIIASVDRTFGGHKSGAGDGSANVSSPEKMAAARYEVLSHFRCPCGKCGMDNLAECECSHPRGAKEVRAFLDRKLAGGMESPSQLVAEIEKVYGAKKF